ncbi:hypothetical protein PsYK624_032620 [Phanerochaete sordida]|uniref:Transmembrane protein n=1 Tax=Phanerochaete sordida TaxID=48140 RepID=A0A9P3G3G7_9APHY|nr:hypothetical protein PsYK624_032620 [Phanerochaete sordida]
MRVFTRASDAGPPGPLRARLRGVWRQTSLRVKIFYGLALLVVALAVVFSEGLMAVAMSQSDDWASQMVDDVVNNQTGIVFLGHVYNIDIPSRQVDVSWLILGCGDLRLNSTVVYSKKGYCGRLNTDVDFYVDGATQPTYSYSIKANPLDPTTRIPVFVQAMQSFSTTHLLVIYAWRGLDQQYGFPFDGYQLETTFLALASSSNTTLPILGLRPISSTDNFSPALRFDRATLGADANGTEAPTRTLEMALARTGFARTYVMTLFVVNWGLTAVVVFITVSAGVGQEVTESILLLPISVILTIPALRALWDGAPAFGLLLDSCGTFLQMVIVSVCSMFLVLQIGLNKDNKAKESKLAPPPPAHGADYAYQAVPELDREKVVGSVHEEAV